MTMTLERVLEQPALRQSRALLLAGDATRSVRWVHSSEVYEIAPLLRGGELLLTTGLGLAGVDEDRRRAYVRSLADRDVAGLALELGRTFDQVPVDMVDEGRRLGLPVIALQEVYPFVEVTEQVNSAILDSSITRLRHADDIGRALSRVLAEREGLGTLTSTLAAMLERPVVLTDATGTVLVTTGDLDSVLRAPAATATIAANGMHLGGLVIGHGAGADDRVQAAVERAPEIFAIEVLRQRQQAVVTGLERRDLLERLLAGSTEETAALEAHAAAAGIPAPARWVGLAIAPGEGHHGLSLVQDVTRLPGVFGLAAELDGRTYALLALRRPAHRDPSDQGSGLLDQVADVLRRDTGPVAALGPAVTSAAAGRSLRAAQATLAQRATGAARRLLHAEDCVADRVLGGVRDPLLLRDLVEEQLGALLDAPHGAELLSTLECYLESGCSKAATARVLHLRRQSVHQRLDRVAAHLGRELSDPGVQTGLRLAIAARTALAR